MADVLKKVKAWEVSLHISLLLCLRASVELHLWLLRKD